jgi:aspartate kinase
VAARLFEALSSAGLNVDLIVQATHEGTSNDIAFTLADTELERARAVCQELLVALGADQATLTAEAAMAKLSISGAGILGRPRRWPPACSTPWPRPASTCA